MSLEVFSIKEAIGFGLKKTKENFGVIIVMALIYGLLQGVVAYLEVQAGESMLDRDALHEFFDDKALANQITVDLLEHGYINKIGWRQERLKNLENAYDLKLSPALEEYRADIYIFLEDYQYRLPFPPVVYGLMRLLFWIMEMLFTIGFIKISLDLVRGSEFTVSDLWSYPQFLIAYVLASIMYAAAVFCGVLLLIIPGIIFSIMFQFYAYLIVDEEMGPVESLKTSQLLTKGVRKRLFLFNLSIVGVNILGFLCLIIGLFWTVPATYVAAAYVYNRIRTDVEGEEPEASGEGEIEVIE